MEGILLYVAVLAILYLAFITLGRRISNASDIAYRVMLSVIAVEMLMMWMFRTTYITSFPHLMRVNSTSVFLLAPSFFIFVKAKLLDKEKVKFYEAVHLIPFLFMLIYLLPFYILSSSEKLELYHQWKQGVRLDTIPTEAIYRTQQMIYVGWIVLLLIKRWTRADRMVVLMAGAFLFIWLIDVFRFVYGSDTSYLLIWIHMISFLPLLIFFEGRFRSQRRVEKYSTSGIDSSKSQELASKIKELLERRELFKNTGLTLAEVAEELGVHHNYISQAVNAKFSMSFSALINSMRVDDAKKSLAEKGLNHLTLEAIAEMSGFNSVSSFNSSFKKLAGETPSQYKRRVQSA